jgi:E3 ubiquitin-protein ligase HUWE1
VNLCTHRDNRQALVQILVDMLMLDLQGVSKKSVDASEPPFRLYGCHANITYSRPQSSNGN